jgi:16S rRNA (guanine966-N2)-methyltransferase
VRVIGGAARGRRLKGGGEHGVRPTSDLVRGAMFDILQSMAADFSRVLDLYAGTGALGIEALSRGAGWCDFVEKERRACRIIEENLEMTGFAEKAAVFCLGVERALTKLTGEYSLILADPPYADEESDGLLRRVASSSLVQPETVIVLEHSKRKTPLSALGQLPLLTSRRHGDTIISIYRCGGD